MKAIIKETGTFIEVETLYYGKVDSTNPMIYKDEIEIIQVSPWISVQERLPEDHTGVFFIVEWKDKRKNYYVGVYDGNQCWESDYRIFLPNSPLGNVTHWMPIPE